VVVAEEEEYELGEEAAESVTTRAVRATEVTLPHLLLGTSSSLCTLYGHDRFEQALVLCIRKRRRG